MQKSPNTCCMVHVVLTIPKPSVWSMENVVNAFPKTLEKEQIRLRRAIHSMLGLTMAWYLNGTRFTNQYVVPYYPQLLLLFDCHLNVEISAGLGTVKYLSKYIYKSPDRATMEISGGMQNEIKAHLDGHFIGPTEAC